MSQLVLHYINQPQKSSTGLYCAMTHSTVHIQYIVHPTWSYGRKLHTAQAQVHCCFHFSQIWGQAPPRPANPGPLQATRPRRWRGAIFSARVHCDSPVGWSYHSGEISQPRHFHPGHPQKYVPVSEDYQSVEIITKASGLWVLPVTSASFQIYLQPCNGAISLSSLSFLPCLYLYCCNCGAALSGW